MATKPTIAVINGPNLNLLGTRQPEIYGTETLDDILRRLEAIAKGAGLKLTTSQSNSEAGVVEAIQAAGKNAAGIIINAGALTHTSIAVADALRSAKLPTFEVHISNIHARESFRAKSYISPVATGLICGFGTRGYDYALLRLVEILS